MDRSEIVQLITASLSGVLAEFSPGSAAPTEATALLGDGSELDSLGLVMFVVDLEMRLRKVSAADLALADALVLPHGENPFGSVASLTDYLGARLPLPPAASS